jgi:hypothetical protein
MTGSARIGYWTCAVAMAILMLLAANAAASTNVFGLVGARAKKPKPVAWKTTNSRLGKSVISMTGVLPGQQGSGRVVISNSGTKPIKKITLTQDQVQLGGFSPALQLQVFDTTAKKCLYPRPKLVKPKPHKKPKPEPKTCATWMPFTAGKALKGLVVPQLKGTTWRVKEKHSIDVRWRLTTDSPPSDQGKSASFRLVWRASA